MAIFGHSCDDENERYKDDDSRELRLNVIFLRLDLVLRRRNRPVSGDSVTDEVFGSTDDDETDGDDTSDGDVDNGILVRVVKQVVFRRTRVVVSSNGDDEERETSGDTDETHGHRDVGGPALQVHSFAPLRVTPD